MCLTAWPIESGILVGVAFLVRGSLSLWGQALKSRIGALPHLPHGPLTTESQEQRGQGQQAGICLACEHNRNSLSGDRFSVTAQLHSRVRERHRTREQGQ